MVLLPWTSVADTSREIQGPVSKWNLRQDLPFNLRHLEMDSVFSHSLNLKMSEPKLQISSQAPHENGALARFSGYAPVPYMMLVEDRGISYR